MYPRGTGDMRPMHIQKGVKRKLCPPFQPLAAAPLAGGPDALPRQLVVLDSDWEAEFCRSPSRTPSDESCRA